jgi:hypothetical protein
MIKSRRMRWAGHVTQMGKRGIHIGCWRESQREIDHLEDQDVGGWTILNGSYRDRMGWYGLDRSGSG